MKEEIKLTTVLYWSKLLLALAGFGYVTVTSIIRFDVWWNITMAWAKLVSPGAACLGIAALINLIWGHLVSKEQ